MIILVLSKRKEEVERKQVMNCTFLWRMQKLHLIKLMSFYQPTRSRMSTIKVIVNGARGQMGMEAVKAISKDINLELVGETDIGDDLSAIIQDKQAQVVVDFTVAHVVYENTLKIIENGVCPVIGTTGLLQEQVRELQQRCVNQSLGGIIAPNFAIGAVLMMKFAKEAAQYLPNVEIVELHHDRKVDSPSGTALKTSQMIAQGRTVVPSSIEEKEIFVGARGAQSEKVRIHSIRLPGLVAHQEVIFGGNMETLTIRHDSIHRESFMPGVCLSCKKVVELQELIYGLENLL